MTIIFSPNKKDDINNLRSLIDLFEEASGFRHKSEFLGINCNVVWVDSVANKFVCKVGEWPTAYLGLPFIWKTFSIILGTYYRQH